MCRIVCSALENAVSHQHGYALQIISEQNSVTMIQSLGYYSCHCMNNVMTATQNIIVQSELACAIQPQTEQLLFASSCLPVKPVSTSVFHSLDQLAARISNRMQRLLSFCRSFMRSLPVAGVVIPFRLGDASTHHWKQSASAGLLLTVAVARFTAAPPTVPQLNAACSEYSSLKMGIPRKMF